MWWVLVMLIFDEFVYCFDYLDGWVGKDYFGLWVVFSWFDYVLDKEVVGVFDVLIVGVVG